MADQNKMVDSDCNHDWIESDCSCNHDWILIVIMIELSLIANVDELNVIVSLIAFRVSVSNIIDYFEGDYKI